MRHFVRRSLTTTAVLTFAAGIAACGTDETTAATTGTPAITSTDDIDVAVDSMVGLEVTAVGNVSDILSDEAIRIDRDGLGNPQDKGEVGKDYTYDFDYYNYRDLTANDKDFGDDDLGDKGVLVVTPTGLKNRTVNEAVRVSGTIRRFDQDTIEAAYDLNLEDDLFDGYDDTLVIVAKSVSPASAPPVNGSTKTPDTSPSPSESSS